MGILSVYIRYFLYLFSLLPVEDETIPRINVIPVLMCNDVPQVQRPPLLSWPMDTEALALDDCEELAGFEWLSPLREPLDASALRFEPLDLALGDARAASAKSDGATPESAARAKQRRAKASFDSNRARTERRLELLHLRQQAGELERHLSILRRKEQRRQSKSKSAAPRAIGTSADDSGIAAALAARSWRQTARALSGEREKAEKENIRLRLLVDGHVKTARQLRRILLPKRQRRVQIDLEPAAPSSASTSSQSETSTTPLDADIGGDLDEQTRPGTVRPITSMCPETMQLCSDHISTNTQIFEVLSRSLAHARSEIDSLFVANGLAATEKSYRSARVEQNETTGTMIEFVASKAFPHPMELTESIVWRHFGYSQRDMPDRTLFRYHDNYKVGVPLATFVDLREKKTNGLDVAGRESQ